MIEKVRELASLLRTVADDARAAQAATVELSALAPLVATQQAAMVSLQTAAAAASLSVSGAVSAAQGASSSFASVAEDFSGSAAAITAHAARAQSSAASAADHVKKAAQDAERSFGTVATRLDDILAEVAGATDGLAGQLAEMIGAVKLGAISINDLLVAFGDAIFEGQKVRDQLRDIPFDYYKEAVSDLVKALRAGSVEIGEVLAYLSESQFKFAQELTQAIELFREGRVTLKRVADLVAQIQKTYPNSDFSDLAQALYDSLKRNG